MLYTRGIPHSEFPCSFVALVTSMESSCCNMGKVFSRQLIILSRMGKMAAWPQHKGSTIVFGNKGTEQKKIKTEERSNYYLGNKDKIVRNWEQSNVSVPQFRRPAL